MANVVLIVFSILYWGAFAYGMFRLVLWGIIRQREVNAQIADGYVCIGCSFLTGPIMVPPEAVFPPEVAKRLREQAKEKNHDR